MKIKLNKVANDTNNFLKKYLRNQKNTDLIKPIKYVAQLEAVYKHECIP